MATGEKALVLKQTMSVSSSSLIHSILFFPHNNIFAQVDQLEEIKDIIEMKVSHRKNIKRRKQKFGYESNSLIGLDMANANVIAPGAEDDADPFEE